MTLLRNDDGTIAVECDGCPTTFDSGVPEVRAALARANAAGWFTTRVVNLWSDFCPDCLREGTVLEIGERRR